MFKSDIMNDKDSNNVRKTVPCDKLYQLYVNEAKSDADIASLFKVSKNSIYRRRVDCGIPTRKGMSNKQSKSKIILDRERLRHLYVDQQKNEKEVAAILGCDPRIVKRNLSDYGIKIRKIIHIHDKIDKDNLRRMCEIDGRTDISIAQEFDVSYASVYQLRKRYGIKSRITLLHSRIKAADLKDMYRDKNMSVSDISISLDCGESTIYDRLKILGIPLRENHSKARGEYLKWCKKEGARSKQEMELFLGGRCQICHRTNVKQFHIHHMCYMPFPNDIIYDNYAYSDEYHIMLRSVVMSEKWRFRLLCGACHQIIGPLAVWPFRQTNLLNDILHIMDEKRYVYPTNYNDL